MASDQPSTSGLSLEEQRALLQEEDLFDEEGDALMAALPDDWFTDDEGEALMAALPDIASNEVSHCSKFSLLDCD